MGFGSNTAKQKYLILCNFCLCPYVHRLDAKHSLMDPTRARKEIRRNKNGFLGRNACSYTQVCNFSIQLMDLFLFCSIIIYVGRFNENYVNYY
jgi:hypothetical protein